MTAERRLMRDRRHRRAVGIGQVDGVARASPARSGSRCSTPARCTGRSRWPCSSRVSIRRRSGVRAVAARAWRSRSATRTDGRRPRRERRDPRARGDRRRCRRSRRIPAVREVLVARQRAWVAEHGGGVVEGRDIGTVVFPDAPREGVPHRERRGAGPAASARRGRGRPPRRGRHRCTPSSRAATRSTRTAPSRRCKAAPDALVVDTTGRDVDDVVAEIVERFEAAGSTMMTRSIASCVSSSSVTCAWSTACASSDASTCRGTGRTSSLRRTDRCSTSRSPARSRPGGSGSWARRRCSACRCSARSSGRSAGSRSSATVPIVGPLRDSLRDPRGPANRSSCIPRARRQRGREIAPLQPGAAYLAAKAGVPIVPVGIAGAEETFRTRRGPAARFRPDRRRRRRADPPAGASRLGRQALRGRRADRHAARAPAEAPRRGVRPARRR